MLKQRRSAPTGQIALCTMAAKATIVCIGIAPITQHKL